MPPIHQQKWWPHHVSSLDQLHDFLESECLPTAHITIRINSTLSSTGNTTFLFETPTVRGDFNNHPDLYAGTVLVTFNQTSYRNFADKKLYVRYNYLHQYSRDVQDKETHRSFFFMHTPLVKGPYGLDPLFNVSTFNERFAQVARDRVLVLSWTSLYPDDELAPFGYTAEMVKEMQATIRAAQYTFQVLEFDAVHASWSGRLLGDLFHVTKWVLFFASEETLEVANLINVPELKRMVGECGLNRTFLRVHDSVREVLVPLEVETRKRRRSRFHARNSGALRGGINLFVTLLLGVYWVR